jgi:hypothetical protein
MTGKKLLWALLGLLVCWTLLPTMLSYGWGFQDYFQDWASARNWWEGIAVYSPHCETVDRYLGQDFASLPDGKLYAIVATVTVNAHPPSSVLFYLPFALLPYGVSYFAWNLLSMVCLAWAAVIVAQELELTPSPRLLAWITVLAVLGRPLFEQMFFGQSSAVMSLMLVFAWQAHRRGWQYREGSWLGIAAAFKLFPLVLFMIPFGTRRWRSLTTAVGVASLSILLSVFVFGTKVWTEYTRTGLSEAVAWSDLWSNVSLNGFWKRLFVSQNRGLSVQEWTSPVSFWAGYLCTSALVGLITLRRVAADRGTTHADSSYGLAILAMLLLSPTCWPTYFLMAILPLILLWRECPAGSYRRYALVVCLLLLFGPASVGMFASCFVLPFLSTNDHDTLHRLVLSVANPGVTLVFLGVPTYALAGVWTLAAISRRRSVAVVHESIDPIGNLRRAA